jgi:hypothetical protein
MLSIGDVVTFRKDQQFLFDNITYKYRSVSQASKFVYLGTRCDIDSDRIGSEILYEYVVLWRGQYYTSQDYFDSETQAATHANKDLCVIT